MKYLIVIILLINSLGLNAQYLSIRGGVQMVDENLTHMETDVFKAGSILEIDFKFGGKENLFGRVGTSFQRFRVEDERKFSKSVFGSIGVNTNNWLAYASLDGGYTDFESSRIWFGATAGSKIPMVDNIYLNIEMSWRAHEESIIPDVTNAQMYFPSVEAGITWKLFKVSDKVIYPGTKAHYFYN